MLAKINSVAVVGLTAEKVEVEVDLSGGLPGLPAAFKATTQENCERVHDDEEKQQHDDRAG